MKLEKFDGKQFVDYLFRGLGRFRNIGSELSIMELNIIAARLEYYKAISVSKMVKILKENDPFTISALLRLRLPGFSDKYLNKVYKKINKEKKIPVIVKAAFNINGRREVLLQSGDTAVIYTFDNVIFLKDSVETDGIYTKEYDQNNIKYFLN